MFRQFLKRVALILIKKDPGTTIDFVGHRKTFIIASSILVGLSMLMLVINVFARGSALNYGTDFRGGTQIQIEFRKAPGLDTLAVRKAMKELKYRRVTVIKVSSGAVEQSTGNTYLIRMETQNTISKEIEKKVRDAFAGIKDPKTNESMLFRFRLSPSGDSVKLQFTGPVSDDQIRAVFSKVPELKIADSEEAITRPGRPELHKVRVTLQGVGERIRRDLNRVLKKYVPRSGKDQFVQFDDNHPFQLAQLVEAIEKAGYKDDDIVDLHLGVRSARIFTEDQFRVQMSAAGVPLAKGAGGLSPIGDPSDKRWRLTLRGKVSDVTSGLDGKLKKAGVEVITSFRVRGYGAVKEVKSVVAISSKVGKRLRNDGIMSVVIALGLLLVYIGLRFDLKYAPGAVVALAHDVTITVGIFALAWREFNLDIVAALLTIVGYSLNDTIVVYDRIRENVGRLRDRSLEKVVNVSVNETLSRTVLTSFTTFIVVAVILVLARGVIWDFALALAIGIIVGTYSSVFIASPIAIWLHNRFETKEGRAKARKKAAKKKSEASA